MSKQTIREGGIVYIGGYEFIVKDLSWHDHNGERCARFTGVLTNDPMNDDIRYTSYNGGRYGGTHYAP